MQREPASAVAPQRAKQPVRRPDVLELAFHEKRVSMDIAEQSRHQSLGRRVIGSFGG